MSDDQFPPDVVEAVAWAMEHAPAGDTPNPNAPDFAIWKQWENEAIAAIHTLATLGYQRVPDGYVVVPRESNKEMLRAAVDRKDQSTEESMYHGIWRSMVGAATEE
jgi:hypothetical protein